MDVILLEEIRDIINTQVSAIANQRKTFTANGTFKVPTGVTTIFVTAIAAGGDGEAGTEAAGGKGGNSGQEIIRAPISVTAGASIAITVGTGDTKVGNYLTLKKGLGKKKGGIGGVSYKNSATYATATGGGGGGGAGGLFIDEDGGNGGNGSTNEDASGFYPGGGAGGNTNNADSHSGGTALSGGGAGGNFEHTETNTNGNGGNATYGNAKGGTKGTYKKSTYLTIYGGGGGGAGGGYGAGGGGGGSSYSATPQGAGGAGGKGIVIIEW